jgi:hypothetical protein
MVILVTMSTKEFILEMLQTHKDDVNDILKLLDVLKGLPKEEEKRAYEICVTSNL